MDNGKKKYSKDSEAIFTLNPKPSSEINTKAQKKLETKVANTNQGKGGKK